MRILCATDFSECAAAAVRVATRLARRFGDDLVLVHALQLPPAGAIGLDGPTALEYDRRLREAVERGLADAAAPVRAEGVEVQVRAVEGTPAAAIVSLAAELDARMIVLGSVGHGAVERFVLGSVADRVARTADRPVLAVRGRTEGLLAAEEARPLRLLVGVDASPASEAILEWVRLLRSTGPADVTFVHVFWPPVAPPGLPEDLPVLEPEPHFAAHLERSFRERIGTLPGRGEVSVRAWPALGSLAYALNRWAEEVEADLLLVGNEHRNLLERLWRGSASLSVLHHARVSVLAVPPPPEAEEATAPSEPAAAEPAEAAAEATGAEAPGAGAPAAAEGGALFRRVVLPLDLSDRHEAAVRLATGLVGTEGELVLLHVVEVIPGLGAEEEQSFYRRLEEQARARLGPLRARLEARGVRCSVELRYGRRVEEIVRCCDELAADLVVLSSHRVELDAGGAPWSTLSYKVGILAQCPVLLVK